MTNKQTSTNYCQTYQVHKTIGPLALMKKVNKFKVHLLLKFSLLSVLKDIEIKISNCDGHTDTLYLTPWF